VAHAQTPVKGKVTDDSGSGMPGVNILVKNTTSGTTTDGDGNYSLNVESSDAVLVFSFIGFNSQEVAVNGRTTIDVSMVPNIQSLNEVVVIGYGTARKSDVTGALARVDEAALREVPTPSLALALQGRAAGVDIQRTTSRPGGGAQIRIRGNRSLMGMQDSQGNVPTNNDPLLVVDGIPYSGNLNDINMNDVTSVDVLKDASATAIYGSRGSNGVILISTKRGKIGKPQLSYDGYYGVNKVLGKYDLYNGKEFDAFRSAAGTYGATPEESQSLAEGVETDWQDLMYKDGFITNHDIGLSGGTEDTQYSLGAGYFKETTVLPGQAFTRYSLRGTIDQKIGDRVKIGLNTLNTLNITDGENVNPMFQIMTLSPLYRAYEADGTINQDPAFGSADPTTRNPLLLYNEDFWSQNRKRLRTFNSLYGEIKIIDGLRYRLNVGLDYFSDTFGQYYGTNTPMINGGVNTAQVRSETNWSYTLENLILFDKTLADNHKINFTGLFSVQELENSFNTTNAQDVAADYLQFYNFGLANTLASANGGYSKWGLLSYMGRVNYNYADRYLLTLTARADGSSRLAEGNKWFYYPAAALAWNVHNESFLRDLALVSNLKLRVGWGKTSNQAIAPYQSLGGLGRVPYNFGSPGTGTYGYLVNNLPNPDLTWEFTTTTNIGIDLGLWKNRLTASVELYQQKTNDILQSRALPVTSGVPGNILQNVGKTENKGVEITLSGVVIESKSPDGFNWSVDLNYAVNREEITELAEGVTEDIGNGWFVGHPVDVIYDYKKLGIWQLGEEAQATALGNYQPGDIKLWDKDGSGVLDAADRMVIGTLQPDWQGGITNRFTYKGFDLSIVAFARVGGMLVSTLYQSNIAFPVNTLEGRRSGPQVDYWTPENPTNAYPKPGRGQVPFGAVNPGTTLGYFDGTYMKIRSINLGYNLPADWLGRTGISSVRLYLTAQNPFKAFFSEYVKEGGLDPESTGRGAPQGGPLNTTPGFGNRLVVAPNTPLTRSFIVGLNIKY
jgi:TonB-linked SusC/RagA family outer membrane protein